MIPNGFRPMSSAPLDGALVLLVLDDDVVRSGWFEEGVADRCWYATYRVSDDDHELVEPKGWLPMPIDWEAALKRFFDQRLGWFAKAAASGGFPVTDDGMESWSDWLARNLRATAQGMSAFGQDPKGLEAKPASPVAAGDAPSFNPPQPSEEERR